MKLTLEEANRIMAENNGHLDLYNTEITELPENLTVGCDLYLSFTEITELPKGLKVGGDLDLRNTPITKLPDNLKVDGNIFGDPNLQPAIKRYYNMQKTSRNLLP